MEIDHKVAREHLAELDGASEASQDAALQALPPWWLYVAVALLAPAAVSFYAAGRGVAQGGVGNDLLRIGSIAVAVCVAIVIGFAYWKERTSGAVRPLPPIRGGKSTGWSMASSFTTVLGLILPVNLMTTDSSDAYLVIAVASFLWLAIVPLLLIRKHAKVMKQR